MEFLGHKIKDGKLMMDSFKVQAIQDRKPPTKRPDLRSFHGLVNYYLWVIKIYSIIASSLTNLLKDNHKWEWTQKCLAAFERLKQVVSEKLVMILSNYSRRFKIHTSISGGVLMQGGHQIAYESHEFNDTKKHYTI